MKNQYMHVSRFQKFATEAVIVKMVEHFLKSCVVKFVHEQLERLGSLNNLEELEELWE